MEPSVAKSVIKIGFLIFLVTNFFQMSQYFLFSAKKGEGSSGPGTDDLEAK